MAAARHPPRRHLRHRPARLSVLSPAGPNPWPGLHRPRVLCGDRPIRPGLLRRPRLAQRHGARRDRRHRLRVRGVGLHPAAALDHRGRLGLALDPDRWPVRLGLLVAAGPVLPPARASDPRRVVEHGRQRAGVRRGIAAEGARADRAAAGPAVRAARPAAAAHVAVVSDAGAPPSPPATCSTPSRATWAPSAPSARSPSTPKAATRRSRPMPKPTSICCASPSICWRAPSVPHPRGSCCRCCCAAAMPAANRPCACSTMRPRRCSTTATCCSRRSIRCGTA